MYKEFYGEDREWALWRIGGGRSGGGRGTGGIRERKEWVMGVLKKWELFPMLPCARFFSPTFLVHQSLFSLIEPFTTINSASHLFNFQYSDQTIQTDLQSKTLDQNSTTVNQIHPRPSYSSTTPDHPQTRQPSDHQIRPSPP